MNETSSNVTGGTPPPPGDNKVAIYALCGVAGIVIGVVATLALTGGVKGGQDPVVAEYSGKSVRASEALASVKTRIFDLEDEMFRTKEQAINDFVEQRLLDAEAKKQNVPIEQLLEKEAGGEVGEVSDKDIEEFLTSKGLSLNDPRIRKEDVRDYLKYRKKFDKRQAYVAKLKQTSHVKLLIAEPQSPKISVATEGFPTWGKPNAPVTIVEFSDHQCPFCARAIPTIERIKKEYGPDKVRIVFRDMPLPSHNRANPAALAAHCANDQGKFWEYSAMLFENQSKLEDTDLKDYAKKLGLEEAKFAECYASKKHQTDIDKSRREAESVGIQATPSFVINGFLLQGAQPFEKFKEKIDRATRG
jgi:protein-disulfide isomerase